MNRRFVSLTTLSGATTLIPVDAILDVDQVIKDNNGGELPIASEQKDSAAQLVLTTRIRYLIADGYAYRYLVHTPEEVLKLISIAR